MCGWGRGALACSTSTMFASTHRCPPTNVTPSTLPPNPPTPQKHSIACQPTCLFTQLAIPLARLITRQTARHHYVPVPTYLCMRKTQLLASAHAADTPVCKPPLLPSPAHHSRTHPPLLPTLLTRSGRPPRTPSHKSPVHPPILARTPAHLLFCQ